MASRLKHSRAGDGIIGPGDTRERSRRRFAWVLLFSTALSVVSPVLASAEYRDSRAYAQWLFLRESGFEAEQFSAAIQDASSRAHSSIQEFARDVAEVLEARGLGHEALQLLGESGPGPELGASAEIPRDRVSVDELAVLLLQDLRGWTSNDIESLARITSGDRGGLVSSLRSVMPPVQAAPTIRQKSPSTPAEGADRQLEAGIRTSIQALGP